MISDLLKSKLFVRTISAAVIAPLFLMAMVIGDVTLFLTSLFAFALSLYEWFYLSKKTTLFIQSLILGIFYMTISYSCFFALREVYSVNVLLLFIIMIWASDIGAYFAGKIIGGPKLIPHISPNKTWAGFVGAMISPAIFGMIYIAIFGFHAEFQDNPGWILMIMGFILGIVIGSVGQAGDLLISFVKRQAKVKDTGTLIPGHGGILDRIDSMLLGAPVFLIIITLMSYVF